MNNSLTSDQALDLTRDWTANNPERLSYQYDNTTAVLAWEKEAVRRLCATTDSPASVLERWATEAEQQNA